MAILKSHPGKSRIGNLINLILIIVLSFFLVLPFIYTINNAFKPIEELYRFPPRIFVQNPTVVNFIEMFNLLNETTMSFWRYVFNTVLLTTVGAVSQIILASLCAYSLALIPYPGCNAIFKAIQFSLMFAGSVTAVPTTIVFAKLGLIDTYAGMLLPTVVSTMGLYLMKQFMESNISVALLEAARIDGAGELKIFFRIAMPLLKPAWLTLIILAIQSLWGAGSGHTYSEVYKTMPQAFSQISTGSIERTGASAAISLIMISVPLICFIVMQSKIIDTMASSGIKG